MTQCSDKWLTTVPSLCWTNQGGTFPPHACSEGERYLPPSDQKGNSPDRRELRRPDLAGTGPEMSPEPNLSRCLSKIVIKSKVFSSRTGCFSGDRTSPEPDVA
ncbi:hypothetical protein OSB04_un001470 [Centaurea solstitialis]|uniref:Uncharacterized protein n=1 Tax=Centaurea solstitialis TaxID=347529 RepID=A0AA38S4A3_9ASTR|nr:hypothetical protein OSB04_un001470 [Centaurea solstitialis]